MVTVEIDDSEFGKTNRTVGAKAVGKKSTDQENLLQ